MLELLLPNVSQNPHCPNSLWKWYELLGKAVYHNPRNLCFVHGAAEPEESTLYNYFRIIQLLFPLFRNFQWLYMTHMTKFKFINLADKALYKLAKLIFQSDYTQIQQKSIPIKSTWAHTALSYPGHTASSSGMLPILSI